MKYMVQFYTRKKRADGSYFFETVEGADIAIPKHAGRAWYSWCAEACRSKGYDGYRTYRTATPLNKPFFMDARVLEPSIPV